MTETTYYTLLSVTSPRHGYAIMQYVSSLTEGRIVLGTGTLYTMVGRLVADGVIEVALGSEKKTYSITPAGLELLQEETERLGQQLAGELRVIGGALVVEVVAGDKVGIDGLGHSALALHGADHHSLLIDGVGHRQAKVLVGEDALKVEDDPGGRVTQDLAVLEVGVRLHIGDVRLGDAGVDVDLPVLEGQGGHAVVRENAEGHVLEAGAPLK